MTTIPRLLSLWTAGVAAFLYLPLLVVLAFSFNRSRLNIRWEGFTFDWYAALLRDADLQLACWNSLLVATLSTLLAVAIGTAGAWGLRHYRGRAATLAETLVAIPLAMPEVVLGVALLAGFVSVGLELGYATIVIAHVTLCLPFVFLSVRARLAALDPAFEEAAADLGAGPLATFRHVVFPQIRSSVIASAILSFSLSFDELIVTYFTASASTRTLPLEIFGRIRKGIDPSLNAVSVLLMAVTILLLFIAGRLRRTEAAAMVAR